MSGKTNGSCELRYVCPVVGCDGEKKLSCIDDLMEHIDKIKSNTKRNKDVPVEIVEAGIPKEDVEILFQCDHRACDSCYTHEGRACGYTTDIRHAENFELIGKSFYEKAYPPSEKMTF